MRNPTRESCAAHAAYSSFRFVGDEDPPVHLKVIGNPKFLW